MQKEKTSKLPRLKTWLLTKPIVFSLLFVALFVIFGSIFTLLQTFFNFDSNIFVFILCALTLILPAWYVIKKLPHDKMSQHDFVAITNGAGIISLVASFITLSVLAFMGPAIKQNMMALYILRPSFFFILFCVFILISLYLIGVAISGVYAKYKRAATLGISPWKIILSMPFTFLMLWTPGYLIQDKTKNNLEIKSSWYTRFNKWVVSGFNNTLFVFLLLLLFKSFVAGITTMALSALLLVIYALWFTKHKDDFVKNINQGYALTAIAINVFLVIAVLVQML